MTEVEHVKNVEEFFLGAGEKMNENMEVEENGHCSGGCQNDHCCNVDKLRPPKTLQELIEGLHKIFSQDKINVEFVQAYMGSYTSNYKEWKKFAKWDQFSQLVNSVDPDETAPAGAVSSGSSIFTGNGKFNLMVLCWNEAQGSSIHSHSDAHCFMKILDGSVKEELFDWPKDSECHQPMNLREVNKYELNQVAYINDDLGLHRVENPSHSDKAVSLHLYSPPFEDCKTFDEKTGHENTCKVTFWSKFGHRTPFGKTGKDEAVTPENN